MLWPFDPAREIRRDNADCRQNRLAGLRGAAGALIITIATAANPYAGQGPALDEGGETLSTDGARLQQLAQTELFRLIREATSPPI